MTETQTCPRRMAGWGPWQRAENLDRWDSRHGVIGQDGVGVSCSFCGSLHPDRFMELVREGWVVGPTDKNYKAYLGRPVTDEEIAARKTRWLASGNAVVKAIRSLGERTGRTAAQIDADIEAEWNTRELPLAKGGCSQSAKFYYQHLSDAQRAEFIALYNGQKMNVGLPGYLYVLPFFCHAGA